jgi:hypothetical protein
LSLTSSVLNWWDQGKYYLREVTHTFSRAKAAEGHSCKPSLTWQMHTLQRLFKASDPSAFAQLCWVQEDLREIVLHEAWGAQIRARCQWAEEGESSSYFFGLEGKHTRHIRWSSPSVTPFWGRSATTLLTFWVCGSITMPPFSLLSSDPVAQDEMLMKVTFPGGTWCLWGAFDWAGVFFRLVWHAAQ